MHTLFPTFLIINKRLILFNSDFSLEPFIEPPACFDTHGTFFLTITFYVYVLHTKPLYWVGTKINFSASSLQNGNSGVIKIFFVPKGRDQHRYFYFHVNTALSFYYVISKKKEIYRTVLATQSDTKIIF